MSTPKKATRSPRKRRARPAPAGQRIPVEIGAVDLYDLIALLNAAALGMAFVFQNQQPMPEEMIAQMGMQAAVALGQIGPDRWHGVTQRLSRAAAAALVKHGITNIEPVLQSVVARGRPDPDIQ